MTNSIKLGKQDIIKLPIFTDEGIDTGEYLEFDVYNISWQINLQNLIDEDKKNKSWLKKELIIIDKKQDVKDKDALYSRNDLEKLKLAKEFMEKEIKIYNMFLGENGVQKLLNGREANPKSFEKIDKIIREQIVPQLNEKSKPIDELIEDKYSDDPEEELL